MSDICTASSIREGFGLNIVEAMACSVPVIATKNRGHNSIITDNMNGFLVTQNNIEEYTEKIIRLIEDDNLKNKFISNGLNDCNKYSNNTILKKIKDILMEHTGE